MKDGFDFEDELAESIAQIIDEETSSAENLYKDKLNRTSDTTELPDEDLAVEYDDDDDEDDNKDNSSRNKLIIIIASVLALIGVIVALAVFFIKKALNESKNNYGYYQNLA